MGDKGSHVRPGIFKIAPQTPSFVVALVGLAPVEGRTGRINNGVGPNGPGVSQRKKRRKAKMKKSILLTRRGNAPYPTVVATVRRTRATARHHGL